MGSKSRFATGAHEFVSQHVREQIRKGRWAAGEAIDVTALAAELAVSASPVREALARLRGEGILSTRYRDGYTMPLLQPHEVAGDYRFMKLLAESFATRITAPMDMLPPDGRSYPERIEAILIALASAADLPTAARALHQSVLRLSSYIRAEPAILPAAETDLIQLEALVWGGDGVGSGALIGKHFEECMSAAPELARYVFERSKRFEKGFE